MVVPAAGSGQRVAAERPKQYLPINGKTVIEQTLSILFSEQRIFSTVVCLAEGDKHWQTLSPLREISTTLGGATRAHSVLNGLLSFIDQAKESDWALVHDAARPCLSPKLLTSFIDQLENDEIGGILALPSNDTVKLASNDGDSNRIETTLDRERIWYAQTPQMFRYGLLKEALQQALEKQMSITDEASAVEAAGYQPKLIVGDATNLKITRPDDLSLAESLLASK